MLTTDFIEHVLATLPGKTVGLLGDLFLDRYLDIDPARDEPSVETGLTAYQVTRVRSYPGALGTVLNNLAALGVGTIVPVTLIGDDGEGYELRQALRAIPGVQMGGVFLAPDRRTPTYTKPMYGDKELNRLDIKNRTPTPAGYVGKVIDRLDELWPQVDAWIVLDQVSEADCGVVTQAVRERVAEMGEYDPGMFVLADSREQIGKFRNVSTKPNFHEAERAYQEGQLSYPPDEQHARAVFAHAAAAYRFSSMLAYHAKRPVFCTRGEFGISVHYPEILAGTRLLTGVASAYPVTGPVDICGAGDSCSAGITAAMVSGGTHEQAAAFGNLVASITVQQIGTTGTAPPEKVRARWAEVQKSERGA